MANMFSEYILWSEGTGHIAGTFSQQPIWQAKPHTSHTIPWRVRPTISDVQWLHLVGEENVRTRNWWDLGLGGRWGGLLCRSSPCEEVGSCESTIHNQKTYWTRMPGLKPDHYWNNSESNKDRFKHSLKLDNSVNFTFTKKGIIFEYKIIC
jgi:hypothetical protein